MHLKDRREYTGRRAGNSMSLKERQDLLALAARHRLIIAEDDPYKDLYYGQLPPPSLKALDSCGGVVYLGTFSKVLTPGLRVGYISADIQLIKRLAFDKTTNYLTVSMHSTEHFHIDMY